MEVAAICTIDDAFSPGEWNAYLERSSEATVYHTLQWRAILERVFHYKTRYVVCRDSSGVVAGILPLVLIRSRITGNRVVSLPLSQYAGPLVADKGVMEWIVKHLRTYLREFRYVRLRCKGRLDEDLARSLGLELSEYYSRCFIPLANRSTKDVWESLHKNSVRRAIRRSESSGIVVDLCGGERDIDCITDLMFRTCKRHGMPSYPRGLTKAIADLLVSNGLARVFVARLEDRIVAATILFVTNKEAIYAYNFSDDAHLKLNPNNALLWSAIRWSLQKGLDSFDMGISSPQDNELFSFKMRWGAIEDKLHEYFIAEDGVPSDRRASMRYKMAGFAWRYLLPRSIASAIGPRLLSHFE